jgi:anti-sigma-K factor RskA
VRRFLRENSLSLFFGLIFVGSLVGQSFAGWQQFNATQLAEHLDPVTWAGYVTSSDFAVDVSENWQSEFLQFWLYLTATVWLLQKGSPESKELDNVGLETDKEQKVGYAATKDSPSWARTGGWRTALYSSSLAIVMGTIFLLSWLVQSVAGWAAYNETRLQQLQDPLSWGAYLTNADFWARSLQNWQSEFLAVGAMAVLSIYLRQRGSSQSKPVGEPHDATGIEG